MYTQVSLKRKSQVMVAWIPSKYAKLGNFLRIKRENKEWENGWEVTHLGGTREEAPSTRLHRKPFASIEEMA